MEPFTLRHEKALLNKRITVSVPPRLRERMWQTIKSYNQSWQCGWDEYTSHLDETETKLKRLLGRATLTAKTQKGTMEGIEAYFMEGYPSNSLEVLEQFWEALGDKQRVEFQSDVNAAMLAFQCPRLMSDGTFFRVDSRFLTELVENAQDRLRQQGFAGAYDEFRHAREALSDNRFKDAIQTAFKSFESTLKVVLTAESGTAHELLAGFRQGGYLGDIPDDKAKAVAKVLMGIALLRNELAGHGQGASVIDIPRSYAALAVHLAAALNFFVMEQKITKDRQIASKETSIIEASQPDPDVSF